jgi:hypothetical protein
MGGRRSSARGGVSVGLEGMNVYGREAGLARVMHAGAVTHGKSCQNQVQTHAKSTAAAASLGKPRRASSREEKVTPRRECRVAREGALEARGGGVSLGRSADRPVRARRSIGGIRAPLHWVLGKKKRKKNDDDDDGSFGRWCRDRRSYRTTRPCCARSCFQNICPGGPEATANHSMGS